MSLSAAKDFLLPRSAFGEETVLNEKRNTKHTLLNSKIYIYIYIKNTKYMRFFERYTKFLKKYGFPFLLIVSSCETDGKQRKKTFFVCYCDTLNPNR